MKANNLSGKYGEKIAARYLRTRLYKIVDTNFKTRKGEIDIICRRGNRLYFIEVKTRTTNFAGYPEEAVTNVKLIKLTNAIYEYLKIKKIVIPWQLDVIAIEKMKYKNKITHYKNIEF